jgi:uncharacterized protein YggU (UPF0235/DUF167 family)
VFGLRYSELQMARADVAHIDVRLTPRAFRDELGSWHDGVLAARVRAAPVDGKANQALCALIAAAAGVQVRQVTVVSGASARRKRLRLEGISAEEAKRKLGG